MRNKRLKSQLQEYNKLGGDNKKTRAEIEATADAEE